MADRKKSEQDKKKKKAPPDKPRKKGAKPGKGIKKPENSYLVSTDGFNSEDNESLKKFSREEPGDNNRADDDDRGLKISPGALLGHLDAFRSRILIILGLLILFTIAGFFFSDYILAVINAPFIESGHRLNIFNITGGFIIRVKTSFGAAVLLVFPYLIYQIRKYISPKISIKSRRFFNISLISAILLFYSGIAFVYFIILPASIKILLGFIGDEMTSTIGADDYVNFIMIFSFALGLLFDFPVIVMILTKIGILSPQLLIKYRRHAIVVIWIISAFVTPTPDPLNQALVAVPLMIFYEISVQGSKFIKRKKDEDDKE